MYLGMSAWESASRRADIVRNLFGGAVAGKCVSASVRECGKAQSPALVLPWRSRYLSPSNVRNGSRIRGS
ncbi:MAG: hypothetical protein AVDCRST_MAG89-2010 [uncultured Gemmatimonadetes bacterium]|uniref:Uncharacterized protein n=1 Tax=uncultured Gemmatimonadota bacterium TaxID=203437 RepID=A0A6J4LD48_9BACT|nr:MAG: hypothetical protein AVDCRST_MAG89-2010 [uncultured Gemmatimonadota bacterium]